MAFDVPTDGDPDIDLLRVLARRRQRRPGDRPAAPASHRPPRLPRDEAPPRPRRADDPAPAAGARRLLRRRARARRRCPSRRASRVDRGRLGVPGAARAERHARARLSRCAQFIAQVFGNAGDVLKGRQMPSHQSGRAVNQVSWSSCIGPQIPQAVGAAWAMQRAARRSAVAVGLLRRRRDEPARLPRRDELRRRVQGPVRPRLPEQPLVDQRAHRAADRVARRSRSRRARTACPASASTATMCSPSTRSCATRSSARAPAAGPTFIEALTYRIGAHSTSDDPTRYRAQAEVDAWTKKDPLDRLRTHLVASRARRRRERRGARGGARGRDRARPIDEVEALPPPARESLFDDVYAELPVAPARAARRALRTAARAYAR